MLDWSLEDIREELWLISVFEITRKVIKKRECEDDYSYLLSSREELSKYAKEVYREQGGFFRAIAAGSYDKTRILDVIKSGNVRSAFKYREYLDGLNLTHELYSFIEVYGQFYKGLTVVRGDEIDDLMMENVTMLSDDIYLHEELGCGYDCDVEEVIAYLADNGVNVNIYEKEIYDEDEDEEYYTSGGWICRIVISNEAMTNCYLQTENIKLKKLIKYFIQTLVEMHNPEGFILGIRPPVEDTDDGFEILYVSKQNTCNYDEKVHVYEMKETAYAILLIEVLQKELKKEGYALE